MLFSRMVLLECQMYYATQVVHNIEIRYIHTKIASKTVVLYQAIQLVFIYLEHDTLAATVQIR